MMVRKKLAVVVAALGAFQSGVVSALGLGELALESSLNQPLNAEIKLLNIGELDTSQVLVRLANEKDFDRAGISRDYFLSRIKFKVDIDKNGNGTIKLKTSDRVVEPYLNFLVEARWPSGRLLREYTVLLDLPVFSQVQPVSAAPVATPVIEQVRSQPEVASRPSAANASRSSGASSPRQQLAGGELKAGDQYRVRQNETLWEIAAKARPDSDVSVQQTMVTIQRLNPNAFIKGNINTLKAGYVLRLPTDSEVQRVSDNDAAKEVAVQNRAWKTGEDLSVKRGAQLDATSAKSSVADKSSEDSRLSIATPGNSTEEGFSDGEGEGAGGNTSALREELSAAEEQLVKSQRSNDEMVSRLGDMEAKMATLQRLLELKEDQLTALQNTTGVDAEVESQSTQQEVDAETDTESPVLSETPQPETPQLETEQSEAEQPKPATAKPESKGFLDELLSNPLYAGLGLGALALALVAVLMGRRRKDDDQDQELVPDVLDLDDAADGGLADDLVLEEDTLVESEVVTAEEDEFEGMSVGDFSTDMDLAPEEELSFDSSLDSVADVDAESVESVQSETGDAIAEADIYVAYGRYQQAMDLLAGAIAAEPQRSDLYVKLLEVCIETRDKPAFQQHYTALQGLGDDAAIAQVKDMLSSVDGVSDWLDGLSTVPSDFSDADMDAELIEGDEASSETEAVDFSADDELDLDLDLDLDGDELDSFAGSTTTQFDVADLEAQLAEEGDDLELELDLDSDLDVNDLDLELDLESADEPVDTTLGSLDGDLNLDVEKDSELTSVAESNDIQSDELGLADLDLDSELDLELDELSLDSDLGDLASEFGEDIDAPADLGLDDLDLEGEPDADLDLSEVALDAKPDDELSASSLDAELDLETELDAELGGLDEASLDSDLGEIDLDALDGLPGADSDLDLSSLDDSLSLSDDDATVVGMPAIDVSALDVSSDAAGEDLESSVTDSVSVDDEFDFLADADEVATKLDLARAYIDMGDTEGARDILDEVVQEGNEEQKLEAGSLIERID